MVVDYDGRILAQADPGPGEKIVVAPIDIAAIRAERDRRSGHHMLGHRRSEAYPAQRRSAYPGGRAGEGPISIEGNDAAIRDGKRRWKQG
jgi:formamidase